MYLKRSLLIISLFLFVSTTSFAAVVYMPFLAMEQNPANPGYVVHASSVNSISLNPSLTPYSPRIFSLAYTRYMAALNGFAFNGQILKDEKCYGLTCDLIVSDAIPNYEIDQYYDPQWKNDLHPFAGYVAGQFAPMNDIFGFNFGGSAKIAFENMNGVTRSALLATIGARKNLWTGFEAGFVLNDLGIPFFVPSNGYFPFGFSLGGMQKLDLPKNIELDILLTTKYILPDSNAIFAGLEGNYDSHDMGFSLKAHYRYSMFGVDSIYDGFSFGCSVRSPRYGGMELHYLLKIRSDGLYHDFAFVYGLAGKN